MLLKLVVVLVAAIELGSCYHYQNDLRWPYRASRATWQKNPYQTEGAHHRIRHGGYQQRYGRLDGVMNKIESYRSTTSTTTRRPKPWNYFRTTTTTTTASSVESLLSDNNYYDYNDEEDEVNDFDDPIVDEQRLSENDDDNDTDYEDEDDGKQDDVQAEEAHESPFTSYKWENYGTRERVEQSRSKQLNITRDISESALAIEHFKRVLEVTKCKLPMPKVISVQKEYPNPGKTFIPRCTLLHRCAEDTGCCHDSSKQCGPVNQTIVQLYFNVYFQGTVKVEKLYFANHTECGCLDRTNPDPSINTIESLANLKQSDPETLVRCKCPSAYKIKYTNRQCTCHCSEKNVDCDRMHKGKEYFSLKDRMCIKDGQCSLPSCEFGDYVADIGRCPRKQET